MKKSSFMPALFLLFSIVFVSLSATNMVHADLYVTIHEDGTISPESAPIQRNVHAPRDIYTLTGAINHLKVLRSNIIIDGNGMYLESDSGTDTIIALHNVRNVMVKNCVIGKSDFGIVLDSSSFITVTSNIITEAHLVMWPSAAILIQGESSNIRIIGNTIENNDWGIIVYGEPPNLIIHHNNFVGNVQNFYVGSRYISSFSARWDNGTTGNYWSNYRGVDNDGDGIGDTPYQIYQNITDNYPLMEAIEPHMIPEFLSWTILPLIIVATVVVIIARNKLRKKGLE